MRREGHLSSSEEDIASSPEVNPLDFMYREPDAGSSARVTADIRVPGATDNDFDIFSDVSIESAAPSGEVPHLQEHAYSVFSDVDSNAEDGAMAIQNETDQNAGDFDVFSDVQSSNDTREHSDGSDDAPASGRSEAPFDVFSDVDSDVEALTKPSSPNSTAHPSNSNTGKAQLKGKPVGRSTAPTSASMVASSSSSTARTASALLAQSKTLIDEMEINMRDEEELRNLEALKASTPSVTGASPQTPKSPKANAAPKGKAPTASEWRTSKAAPPAEPIAGLSTPAETKGDQKDSKPEPKTSNKCAREEETPADEAHLSPPSAPSPQRVKSDWDGTPSEEMVKRKEEVENINTAEDAAAFVEHMTELLLVSE
ncbi:hypothetical protein DENSPDRAFT_847113 [Dentipellis sp. KUC8613]|nr:hypothetical protein DENSPDRAFT_847113 [Dentipellis sp. KUC8613]